MFLSSPELKEFQYILICQAQMGQNSTARVSVKLRFWDSEPDRESRPRHDPIFTQREKNLSSDRDQPFPAQPLALTCHNPGRSRPQLLKPSDIRLAGMGWCSAVSSYCGGPRLTLWSQWQPAGKDTAKDALLKRTVITTANCYCYIKSSGPDVVRLLHPFNSRNAWNRSTCLNVQFMVKRTMHFSSSGVFIWREPCEEILHVQLLDLRCIVTLLLCALLKFRVGVSKDELFRESSFNNSSRQSG